jgi:hypothetical protein
LAKTPWSKFNSYTPADSEPNSNCNRKPNFDARTYSDSNCDQNTKAEPDTQRDSHAAATPNASAASYAAELRRSPLPRSKTRWQGQRTALYLPLST